MQQLAETQKVDTDGRLLKRHIPDKEDQYRLIYIDRLLRYAMTLFDVPTGRLG
jgi:hypothetical protein